MPRIRLTPEEELQKLKDREATLRQRIKQREKTISQKKRQERNHNLIEKGGLVEIAGLMAMDPATLLGALLTVADQVRRKEEAILAQYREQGMYILSLTTAQRKALEEKQHAEVPGI